MSNFTSFTSAIEAGKHAQALRAKRIACKVVPRGGVFHVEPMGGKAAPIKPKAEKAEGLPTYVKLRLTPDGGVWSDKGQGFKPVTNGMTFDDCREALVQRGYQKQDKNLDQWGNQTWSYVLASLSPKADSSALTVDSLTKEIVRAYGDRRRSNFDIVLMYGEIVLPLNRVFGFLSFLELHQCLDKTGPDEQGLEWFWVSDTDEVHIFFEALPNSVFNLLSEKVEQANAPYSD